MSDPTQTPDATDQASFGPLQPRVADAPQTAAAADGTAATSAGRPASPTEAATYEQASARLEAIIRRLDSGEAGLRETLELCREGRELVAFCAAELEAVGAGLEELRLDELVARLAA